MDTLNTLRSGFRGHECKLNLVQVAKGIDRAVNYFAKYGRVITMYKDDAKNDSCNKVLTRSNTYDATKGSCFTWGYTIAMHFCLDRLPSNKRGSAQAEAEDEREMREMEEARQMAFFTPVPNTVKGGMENVKDEILPDAESLLIENEVYEMRLNGLSSRDRRILKMKLEGFSSKEIAVELGMTDNNVTVRYNRPIKKTVAKNFGRPLKN